MRMQIHFFGFASLRARVAAPHVSPETRGVHLCIKNTKSDLKFINLLHFAMRLVAQMHPVASRLTSGISVFVGFFRQAFVKN